MPTITSRSAPEPSGPNFALILALVVAAIVLIVVLLALVLPIVKQRRAARRKPVPSTLEEFMDKAERKRVRHEAFTVHGHNSGDSVGTPLLHDAPHPFVAMPAGRHSRILPLNLPPPLPDNIARSYGDGDSDDDDDPAPQVRTGPIGRTRADARPPGIRVAVPQSAPIPNLNIKRRSQPRAQAQAAQPAPAPAIDTSEFDSDSDSDSVYSQRTASIVRRGTRMNTIPLSPPPVPALPPSPSHFPPPRSALPPEDPPLARGDTIVVSSLLKSRARRLADGDRGSTRLPRRSKTRTEHIERAGSITEIPSPQSDSEEDEWDAPRDPRLSVDGRFSETLAYYTSQPVDGNADGTMSVSSYETVTQRPTRSAI
ncbi:hypothetical protein GGX14DRAFT_669705 [Mycena pura]|uniref:Uncharacterized protein n=1 Tax=Mycena pura TaxID=153505 RepID=A0AAD6VX87_9AGAR|nr:hypothetical protein GGX14DRAFT_669705 [Mycena pura]